MPRAEHLAFFAKFIEKESGIVFSEFNDFQLERRLQDVAKKRGLNSVAELHRDAVIQFDSALKHLVLDLATNNETYFFRDPQVWVSLKNDVLPKIFEKAASENRKPRLWSMACSYGQEAFSLAILSRELTRMNSKFQDAEIVASDIATHALDKTRSGVYAKQDVERGLEPKLLNSYFDPHADGYRAKDEVRKLMRVEHVNLLNDQFGRFGKFDMILCRNVLIYQSVPNKSAVIKKIKSSLHAHGQLLLGVGETMVGLPDAMPSVHSGTTLLYSNAGAISRAG